MGRTAVAASLAACCALFAEALGAAQDGDTRALPVVREERTVEIDGVAELWRLEWKRPPSPVCAPDDALWITCPCHGFAFGEAGELDLVRLRWSREIERLPLTPLFAYRNENLSDLPAGPAALRRFPVLDSDRERLNEDPRGLASFRESVAKREPVRILDLHDFNRDGSATEFVLQIGTLPCGKRESVVVGLTPDRRALHAFTSADHPERPLVLYANHWEALRAANRSVRVIAWECGDHASEAQEEIVLTIDARGIHAVRETFSCGVAGADHGPLVARERL